MKKPGRTKNIIHMKILHCFFHTLKK